MDDSSLVKIVAIVSITLLWIVNALTLKIDSVFASLVVGGIAGLAGYEIGKSGKKPAEDESGGDQVG